MNNEVNKKFKEELNKNLNKVRRNNCSHKNGSRKLPSKKNINSYRVNIAGKKRNLIKTLDELANLELLKLKQALTMYYYKTYFSEPVPAFIVNGHGTRVKTSVPLPRLRQNY